MIIMDATQKFMTVQKKLLLSISHHIKNLQSHIFLMQYSHRSQLAIFNGNLRPKMLEVKISPRFAVNYLT